ncbi:MAG: hypothetical protein RI936_13 [Pseudomonadota bacterium]|jgi:hypothetical protein
MTTLRPRPVIVRTPAEIAQAFDLPPDLAETDVSAARVLMQCAAQLTLAGHADLVADAVARAIGQAQLQVQAQTPAGRA